MKMNLSSRRNCWRWFSLLLCSVSPGFAATLQVINTNDSGAGSLRQAVESAASGDTINFSVTGVITLTNGELVLSNNLTIAGPGADNLSINVDHGGRLLRIVSNVNATLSGLTLRDAYANLGTNGGPSAPGGNGDSGGGISNAGTLTLLGCTISGCSAGTGGIGGQNYGNPGNGGKGGGIYNVGTLNLDTCIITNNSAGSGASSQSNPGNTYSSAGGGGGAGGGVYNAGTLHATNCTFGANGSGYGGSGGYVSTSSFGGRGGSGGNGGVGGGLCNVGAATLVACTFSTNSGGTAGSGGVGGGQFDGGGAGGVGGSGGGIYSDNTLTLSSCTFSGNSGGTGGSGASGGYYAGPSAGSLGGDGGAVYTSGSLQIVACTLAFNSGGTGGAGASSSSLGLHGANGGNGGAGGGIFNAASGSNAAPRSALAARNSAGAGGAGGFNFGSSGSPGPNGSGPDLAGNFTSQGHNLIGQSDGSSGFTNAVNGDLIGTTATPLDPKLGPLQNNGGPTFTLVLLPASPAIDAGDDALLAAPFNLLTDQRGLPRKSGAHVDIGVLEAQALAFTAIKKNGNDILITFFAEAGRTYRIERTDSLSAPSWAIVADNVAGAGSNVQLTDAGAANQARRFYRARTVP